MVPARFVVSVFVSVSVAPLVFRAPSDPAVGPGCWLCPWAAARPRAVRAASFARRVVSKPGQAPPPPTGTAARPSAPSGALHTGGTWCAGVWPGQDPPPLTGAAARPRHRPRALQPGPVRSPPVPSGPSGALHTGGACGSGVPGQAPPPHAGTAAWLSVFSGALHTGGACGSGVPGQASPPRIRAHMGSGERNIAPAWCSSSWHGASLKQKPPTHAHNRRKLAYLDVLGRIILHGAPQQLACGCFFFHSGPACGHRCQQLSADRGHRGRRPCVEPQRRMSS